MDKKDKAVFKKNYDRKNKWINFEEIELDHTYAFTYNPDDQPRINNMTDYKDDVNTWYNQQYMWLSTYKKAVRAQLYCETSPSGRFHFHGTIEVLELALFPAFVLFCEKHAATEMDELIIDDNEDCYWTENYVEKQLHIWLPFFKGNPRSYPLCIDPKNT